MKINSNFPGFDISAKGLSIQRKRMNLIAENIANADVTKTADGQPYQRKYLQITASPNQFSNNLTTEQSTLQMNATEPGHIQSSEMVSVQNGGSGNDISVKEATDQKQGDVVYDPSNPDANTNGYVEESNVNIVTEMVDMISASRSYEANLTALNSSKQMVKDSLEI